MYTCNHIFNKNKNEKNEKFLIGGLIVMVLVAGGDVGKTWTDPAYIE